MPGTQLDVTHPNCPDYCWPFLSPQATAQCLARRIKLAAPTTLGDIYAGSSSIVPGGKYGLSVRHGATTDNLRLTVDDSGAQQDAIVGSDQFTMMFAYRKTDATARASAAFGGLSGGDGEAIGIRLPYNDGNIYFHYGFYANVLTVPVTGITFGDDLWVCNVGLRGMELWQNGILVGSNSNHPTRTSSGATTHFACPAFASNQSDLADTAFVMTWNRQLTVAAIRHMSANPWQVFQPAGSLYAIAPPGIAGTFAALCIAV